MTRRRLLEILIAGIILVLLVTVFLVRPTARRTEPPPAPLFHPVAGALPDFTSEGMGRVAAGSPDRSRTALLYPADFEEPADLYVLTGPGEGVRFALSDSLRETITPKNVGWLDPQTLWVTTGWRYGTVSPGGDLHAVDPATGEGWLVWASPDSGRTQAVAAEPTTDGRSIVVRLKGFDANMMTARDSSVTIPATGRARPAVTPKR
jgi:hypothetical protein